MPPETHYAKSGDVNIAYQVVGEGPLDLVYVAGWISNLELAWEEPSYARFLNRLASFSRVAAAAGPGEVLVSSTVRDLVAGSGITFEDRGEHELKGVGAWRLYSVVDA